MIENLLVLIANAYTEPHRKYHTLEHLTRMFSYARASNIKLNKKQIVAIWLHDAVYNVPDEGKLNEKKSADLVYKLSYEEFSENDIDNIRQMILDTKNHLPTIEDSKIVIDLDLIDLAWDHRYIVNGFKLREEYKYLSDKQWKEGRFNWLENFLKRETIFVSKYCLPLEIHARNNLTIELGILKK